MFWVYMFVLGSSHRLWHHSSKKHLFIGSIDKELSESIDSQHTGNHSIIFIPSTLKTSRSYSLSENECPIPDFNVSLETIHRHMNYYHLLQILISRDVSSEQKLQYIRSNDITKECIIRSITPQLTKNLMSDW